MLRNINRFFFITSFFFGLVFTGLAQTIRLPSTISPVHPRILANGSASREAVNSTISNQAWAKETVEKVKAGLEPYVNRHQTDSTWIVSRLQMYWNTHATDVYIKAGVYDHAEGHAPVPTVRFPGARDNVTIYGAPKLEDLLPFSDDPRGVYLVNRSKPGQPFEWAEIAKTGRTLESINAGILQMAANASILYWISGEEKYARFAYNIFDTYMSGMYYRKPPIDLTHGHHQTIVGLSTFEVIQEVAILGSITNAYDYLFNYIQKRSPAKIPVYTETLKKWAEVQIKHGVAYNNWNLMEARNILNIALVLEDNSVYPDHKGSQHYIDQVLNKSSEKQWSLTDILNRGYDPVAATWNECPGYAQGVIGDFTGFVTFFDQQYNHDILPGMPLIERAVPAIAQYLFPNGYTSAFGDSYYRTISLAPAFDLVANAKKNNKTLQEATFTRYIKTLEKFYSERNLKMQGGGGEKSGLQAVLRPESHADLKESVLPGKIEEYVSPVFFATNVSYFAQRNGFDSKNGLMVAMAGSKGNHMHANGISMEIYGKGIVFGPDSGIGTSYFQQDYAEYYSQFPAHNTVAVDGISAYPVMKSNHGFDVLSSYPASGKAQGFYPSVTYGDLFFIEPETRSDQNRLTSILRTSDSTGYYIDIFRSKKQKGGDKFHDYFYHNLGQQLTLTDNSGKPLDLAPTEKLSFAGGHLFAYDYFWDKKSVVTPDDFNAVFKLSIPGREDVTMNLWMKGSKGREIFALKAPASKSFRGNMIPDSIARLPMPTIVARQTGEAWNQPFVAVFEPTAKDEPKSVTKIIPLSPKGARPDFVGLTVESLNGITDHVFSSVKNDPLTYRDMAVQGNYAVFRQKAEGFEMFLGKGQKIEWKGYKLSSNIPATVALSVIGKRCFLTTDREVSLSVPDTYYGMNVYLKITRGAKSTLIPGKRENAGTSKCVSFSVPEIEYAEIFISSH
ncbi:MAG: heparinase II/III family protein [Sphingobacteriaceae bacterium]|nr:heparinase II/III family protein [Sphingobacteriaceae bacterium]